MTVAELRRQLEWLPGEAEVIGLDGKPVELTVSTLDVSPPHYTVTIQPNPNASWPPIKEYRL
jgi:hypothetical protein